MPEILEEEVDLALATPEEERNFFQRLSVRTNGWLTPANVLDVASVAGTLVGARNIDRRWGKALLIGSHLVDFVDGWAARTTGTANEKGNIVDKASDRLRMAITFPVIWKQDLVPKPVITAVSIRQSVNLVATGYDRFLNHPPRLHKAADEGRSAMFGELAGMGVTALARSVEDSQPVVSLIGQGVGNTISAYYFATDGLSSTSEYVRIATGSDIGAAAQVSQ